jgi:hypothetical protein
MTTLSDAGSALSRQADAYRKKAADVAAKAKDQKFKSCQDLFVEDQKRLEVTAAKIDPTTAAITQALSVLLKTDDQSGTRLLDSLLRAETMGDKDLLLQIQIVEAAGTTIARKTFFGGSAKFSGGAILSYLLTSKDGTVKTAGTYPLFGGRKSEKELVAEDAQP